MDNLQLPSAQPPQAPWQQTLQQWLRQGQELLLAHKTPLLGLAIFLGGNLSGYWFGHRARHHAVKVVIARQEPAKPARPKHVAKAAPKASKKQVAKKAAAKASKKQLAKAKPSKKRSSKASSDDNVFAGR